MLDSGDSYIEDAVLVGTEDFVDSFIGTVDKVAYLSPLTMYLGLNGSANFRREGDLYPAALNCLSLELWLSTLMGLLWCNLSGECLSG